MAFQRVTLAQLRTQLQDRLQTVNTFWSQAEQDRAINEAVAIWQAMTGETVINVTQTVTNTTENLVALTTTDTAGKILSVLRVATPAGGGALREMSIFELDHGFYGWRNETASTTTQRPEYWIPLGISSVMLYPRTGSTVTYSIQAYSDPEQLVDPSTDYIDIDEAELQKVLGMAQAILAFKEGIVEGTENANALKDLFAYAAKNRNKELLKTGLYKNYMGHDDGAGEPGGEQAQQGVRG